MVSERLIIDCPQGIHLRPAGSMCEAAIRYKSKISFELSTGRIANVKSVLSILAAGVKCGEEIVLTCEGEDEQEALDKVKEALFEALNI